MSSRDDDAGWDLDFVENGWTRFRLYYVLGGPDLDPIEVTRRTGLVAHAQAAVGTLTRAGKTRTVAYWEITSGRLGSEPFELHMAGLLQKLRTAWPVFVELGRDHDASLLVEAETNVNPLMEFETDVVEALAELRASIGFDVYPCGPTMLPDDSPRRGFGSQES